jgi:putative serine/threonine protein kinase
MNIKPLGTNAKRETPLKKPEVVPVDELTREPYASVLCFPTPSNAEAKSRVEELKSLGVTALEFCGEASLFGLSVPVLGKGFVGVVVVAHLRCEKVAVKIRRLDADRDDLLHEAEMLSKAACADAAPKLVSVSKNFLLMQLIKGELLPKWLETNRNAEVVKRVLRNVLEACYRLDEAGLDHGELSKAPKHVIVDRQLRPWIVDFETASDKRKTANVPAMSHFLFTSPGEVGRIVAEILGPKNREEMILALHDYKRNKSVENFERVVQACLG